MVHARHSFHVARLARAAAQPGEDLGGIAEGEIVQQDDHLLLVARSLGRIAHDERRRQQLLLLQPDMGVHPVGAGTREDEVVLVAAAGLERRLRQLGHAVLIARRRQAVPVHQRVLVELVDELHMEALAGVGDDAVPSVRLDQAEHIGRLAVDLYDAARGPQLRSTRGAHERLRAKGAAIAAVTPAARKRRRDSLITGLPCLLQSHAAQPQRVGDNGNGTQAHRRSGDDR